MPLVSLSSEGHIATLAFEGTSLLDSAKVGIIIGSILAAVIGAVILHGQRHGRRATMPRS